LKLHTNYHTHLALCGHAIGTCEDYVLEAINQGFSILGFSDHGPIPIGFMSKDEYLDFGLNLQMNEDDFYQKYLPDCLNVQKKYSDQIKIFLGVEIEYILGKEAYFKKLLKDLDYLALGVHYFPSNNRLYNVYYSMNEIQVMDYANEVVRALSTNMYTMITHPDIYLMNYTKNGEHVFDEVAIKAATMIIEACIKNHVYMEINGSGPRRGEFYNNNQKCYLYPRYEFWKLVEKYPDAMVIFGADAHTPEGLNDDIIKETLDFASMFQFKLISEISFKEKP
jgi:histidinol-phosphatase (PHP family)